jgi:hypothetical protein
MKQYTFDSDGNPLTVRKNGVKPRVREIIKPTYKLGKHNRKAGQSVRYVDSVPQIKYGSGSSSKVISSEKTSA